VTQPSAAVDSSRLVEELASLTPTPSPAHVAALADALTAFVLALHPAAAYAPTIDALCRAATSPENTVADAGQRLLFAAVAEPLGDSFEPRGARLYDELFAEVIDFCRRLPEAADVDACLRGAGIRGRDDLLSRKAAGRGPGLRTLEGVRKALVLSRVTIGADVAVTGVVLQRLARLYPDAELCLIGSSAPPVVSAGTGARAIAHRYERRGNLVARLRSWVDLVETCTRELAGLDPEHCVVVDPDSRLTQLGLLPLVGPTVPSVFFESRSYRAPDPHAISELTARWLDETFGADDGATPVSPRVVPAREDMARADDAVSRVKSRGAGRLVGVNLGVGGNPRKRVGGTFELDLLRGLLADDNAVLLDYGAPDEAEGSAQLVARLRSEGHQAADIWDAARSVDHTTPRLLTYRGGLDAFSALLARTDCYVGYDSAFQHIAVAQDVPVVDIFVDPPNPTFPRRWRPSSAPTVRAIEIVSPVDTATAVARVLAAARDLRARHG
jgi:hypothetical protein